MQTKVVLDANVYRETNYGRSGKFASLVDFLKRSDSHLLLLPSVLEEVLATHDREFRKLVEDAKDLVENVAKESFAERLSFLRNTVDYSKEEQALKSHLLDIGRGVTVEQTECSSVDVLEIVKRGARRVPPANLRGEELRDVIHWMTVLAYARNHEAKLLFVTRDNGFWLKDGGLREEILEDIRRTGRDIQMFRDIEDLLRQNSLSTESLDQNRAGQLFDIEKAGPIIVGKVGERLDGTLLEDSIVEVKSGKLVSSNFRSGTVYRVSAESEFVEAAFDVTIESDIVFRPRSTWGALTVGEQVRASIASLRSSDDVPTLKIPISAQVDLSLRVMDQKVSVPAVERVSWKLAVREK